MSKQVRISLGDFYCKNQESKYSRIKLSLYLSLPLNFFLSCTKKEERNNQTVLTCSKAIHAESEALFIIERTISLGPTSIVPYHAG